jgi:GTP-sensing pleiotropic transcriptional regulator CodY
MLPQFNEGAYIISDPLTPPETLPQVTETQFNKSEAVYQGTLRALKLTGMAFDVADARFTVIGKRGKAFGSGIKAATAVERVKGDYQDYLSQVETTAQKTANFENNQAKTVNDRAVSVHTQASMDEKLKQAESDADMARQKTAEKQNQLAEFKKSLGEYLPVAK